MSPKPIASVSLDVDDLWTYMKVHGDPAWKNYPSYLPRFIPRVLDLLDQVGVRITFFVVGRDALRAENAEVLHEVVRRGHEVGNHSFEHEPWLHKYSPAELEHEIVSAEEAIEKATGQRPIGFRGPGYSWSSELFELLERRGYLYDASTLPSYLGPLARAYYFRTSKLGAEERAVRNQLFGTFADGRRPVKPYRWRLQGDRSLLEIPVTTIPVVKLPFHLSYLQYLSRLSGALAGAYLGTALTVCRITGTEPSFLLHPLDLISGEDAPEVAFFPGMDVPSDRKQELFLRALRTLGDRYTIVSMAEHARACGRRRALPLRVPLSRQESAGLVTS